MTNVTLTDHFKKRSPLTPQTAKNVLKHNKGDHYLDKKKTPDETSYEQHRIIYKRTVIVALKFHDGNKKAVTAWPLTRTKRYYKTNPRYEQLETR